VGFDILAWLDLKVSDWVVVKESGSLRIVNSWVWGGFHFQKPWGYGGMNGVEVRCGGADCLRVSLPLPTFLIYPNLPSLPFEREGDASFLPTACLLPLRQTCVRAFLKERTARLSVCTSVSLSDSRNFQLKREVPSEIPTRDEHPTLFKLLRSGIRLMKDLRLQFYNWIRSPATCQGNSSTD
jgi:hypothetical protein